MVLLEAADCAGNASTTGLQITLALVATISHTT
jgi:hypothetical protein